MRAEIQQVGPNDVCVAIQQILIRDYHAAVQQVMQKMGLYRGLGHVGGQEPCCPMSHTDQFP